MFVIVGPPGPPAGVRVDTASITSTSAMVIWIEGQTHGRPVEYHIIEASNEFNDTWTPLNTCTYPSLYAAFLIVGLLQIEKSI